MRRLLLLLLLSSGAIDAAIAQDSTGIVLQRARELYERLELERAVPLLRQVISPAWTFDVSASQRVDANLYLGAALVLLGSSDSAGKYFRAALERDAFADLDPTRFTPAQLDAFQGARRAVFAVGVRPVAATTLDPRTGHLTFTIVATHAASVRCELRLADGSVAPLYVGEIQGLRQIDWDGVLPSGQLAPSGRYAFVVRARSLLDPRTDSSRAYFDIEQQFPALEDTVADLDARTILPERYPASAATGDLLKGLGIAAGALALTDVVSDRSLGRSRGLAAPVITAGLAVGIVKFATGRGRARPENVTANERRRSERAATNAQIRQRNAARLAQTVLVITSAAGSGP